MDLFNRMMQPDEKERKEPWWSISESIVFPVGISGLISRGQRTRARPFSPSLFLTDAFCLGQPVSRVFLLRTRRSAPISLMFHQRPSIVLYLSSRSSFCCEILLLVPFLRATLASLFSLSSSSSRQWSIGLLVFATNYA